MNDRAAALTVAADALAAAAEALRAAALADDAPAGPERLYDVAAAAGLLGIGRSRLYSEIACGRLRTVKSGRRRLVPSSSVAAYIEAAMT